MGAVPFQLLWCSWPQPVDAQEGRWMSPPAWDAAPMANPPRPKWQRIGGRFCWTIDWRAAFGEMRGFHVVFEIRVPTSGELALWVDDGCIIQRADGTIAHEDRSAHQLRRDVITVFAGERLRIACWQLYGDWIWAASPPDEHDPRDGLLRYLPRVRERLETGCGPALKIFTDGANPIRAVLSIYSMILNGYAPRSVLLYGEHQWSAAARSLFSRHLSFAETVESAAIRWAIHQSGAPSVANHAMRAWWVMKTCVAFMCEPREFCMMDDDVFILEPVADAISAFASHDLVYQAEFDHGRIYANTWNAPRVPDALPTGRFNAGLYWMRNTFDAQEIGRRMSRVSPWRTWHVAWEQGFIATLFAAKQTAGLPTQQYFYPLVDGLPDGVLGYDFRNNPCGFKSIHYGGIAEKPTDEIAIWLADDILEPREDALVSAAARERQRRTPTANSGFAR